MMPRSHSLDVKEVSLIKGMLKRGMVNAKIQFYFNRPDRLVNNGRISEIKSGKKWEKVPVSSDFEVDDFINRHELTQRNNLELEPELPQQNSTTTVFTVRDDELIEVGDEVSTSLDVDDPDFDVAYKELREKTEKLLSIGHNALGEIEKDVSQFAECLIARLTTASILLLWSRGNALRSLIRAHQNASASTEPHPAKLDLACASRLEDVVHLFNILISMIPRGVELDNLKIGPLDRKTAASALASIERSVEDIRNITTERANSVLTEQFERGNEAAEDAAGERAVFAAVGTTQNFFIAALKWTFFKLRSTLGNDLVEVVKKLRRGLLEGAVKKIGQAVMGVIGLYVLNHLKAISDFLSKTSVGDSWQFIIDLIRSLVS